MTVKTIWKYQLQQRSGTYSVSMPKGAQLLSVANQNEYATLWALVEPKAPQVKRFLSNIPTGVSIGGKLGPPIGVILLDGGDYVIHVFDEGEEDSEE